MIFFWSLVAFALLAVLLWLIFVANNDTVLKTMRIPTSGDVDGDGDVDAADLAAAKTATHGETHNAPFRVAAMEAKYDAAADAAAASAAVAEAAEASMEAAVGRRYSVATAQDALDTADAAVTEAAEAIQEAAEAIDATTDKAVDSSVEVEAAAESEIVEAASEVGEADDAVRAVVVETEVADVVSALPVVADAINNYPDNLTKIAGIGAVYQKRLYEAGVLYLVADRNDRMLSSCRPSRKRPRAPMLLIGRARPVHWPKPMIVLVLSMSAPCPTGWLSCPASARAQSKSSMSTVW